MSSPLRIAVIGLGTVAQSLHLPMMIRRHDRFEIAAVVDISPRRRDDVAKKFHFSDEIVFETVTQLVEKIRHKDIEIDAAVFAADGLKSDDLLALIKRGIRVLVEAPVGYGVPDVERVAEFERMSGRKLVMVAYPSVYDSSVRRMVEDNYARDMRMLEFETLMPANAVMFGKHNATSAAYDLSTELRSERREKLQAAVLEGAGEGSNQRDRDLFVKGLLTGLMEQLALLRAMYGPLSEMHAVRQWPQQVIPGSIEVLGALEKGPHVRFAWHYLPFAPEFHNAIRFISTRRQGTIVLPEESELDTRGSYTMTHKSDGAIQTVTKQSDLSPRAGLLDAFFEFAARGGELAYSLSDAIEDTAVARMILSEIVGADGRSLDPEPETEDVPEPVEEDSSPSSTISRDE